MTREEAKNKFSNELLERALGIKKGKLKIGAVYKIIDEIYDDFESRVCKNCKWFSDRGYAGKLCTNPEFSNYSRVDKDFGCNRFERRNGEN